MKSSSKVVAGGVAMGPSAPVTKRPGAFAPRQPEAPAHAPPTFLISARGLSVDGFYASEGEGCSGQFIETGADCFVADGSDGGNGFFQFSNNPTTQMAW